MSIKEILSDKSLKGLARRQAVIDAIMTDDSGIDEMKSICQLMNEKQISTFLEAIEEISNKKLKPLGVEYLLFAEQYLAVESNSCKREAARIVGNMAPEFPNEVAPAVTALLTNAHDEGTVIRWSAAYALSRIIVLPEYASSLLVDQVESICNAEEDNGVKNQYVKALKKVKKGKSKFTATEGRVL